MRFAGHVVMLITWRSQASGSMPLSLQLPIRLYMTSALSPPPSEPKNIYLWRPSATTRSAFSYRLLSISTQPLRQYSFRTSRCFSRYANAFAVSEWRDRVPVYCCIQSYSDFISGTVLDCVTASRSSSGLPRHTTPRYV